MALLGSLPKPGIGAFVPAPKRRSRSPRLLTHAADQATGAGGPSRAGSLPCALWLFRRSASGKNTEAGPGEVSGSWPRMHRKMPGAGRPAGSGEAPQQVSDRVNSGSGETCSGTFRSCEPRTAHGCTVDGAQGLRHASRQVSGRVNSGSDETCSHAFRPSFLGLRWSMREEPETCKCRFRRMSQFNLRPCWGSPNPAGITIRATLGPGPGVPGSEGSPSGSSRATRRDDR